MIELDNAVDVSYFRYGDTMLCECLLPVRWN